MADEYILKSYDGGAQKTALTSAFTVGGTTLAVSNGSTFPDGSSGPFVVVVDRGLATEEKFLIDTTSGVNGTTFNIQQVAYDGTSASAHSSGAIVEHCLDAYSIEQANRYVNLQTAKGDLVSHNGTTTAKLTVGANNTILTADSAVSAGSKWSLVQTASLASGAVTEDKISTSAVTTTKINNSAVTTDKLADSSVTATKIAAGAIPSTPSGVVSAFAGSIAPTGYVLCDGTAYTRTDPLYSALFAVIGTTYGAGNGSTTFNVPNLKGRVPVGLDSAQSEFDIRGETGGAKTHTLVWNEMPTHEHGGTTNTGLTNGPMTIAGGAGTSTADNHMTGFVASPTVSLGDNADSFPGANHDHFFITNTAGGSQAHNNLQPYMVLNYIIKT